MKELKNGYFISDDKNLMQIEVIHDFLANVGYWSPNIPKFIVEKAIKNAHAVGVFYENEQVGFARLVTDYATFGYLADVFVLEAHRGKGLSKAIMAFYQEHPSLQYLRRWMLITGDAHGLYKQFNFKVANNPQNIMEITSHTFGMTSEEFYRQEKFKSLNKSNT